MRKIRIFVNIEKLQEGLEIKLIDNDFDYLTKVMRQKIADEIFVFNGSDGEFLAEIIAIEKKSLNLKIKSKIAELKKSPNITLAFALLKNVGIDFIARKGVELGVSSFQPIITQRTIVDKVNQNKFLSNIKEALEQCERNDSANLCEVKKLDKFLSEKNCAEKIFILCDESGKAEKASKILSKINPKNQEIVILIGPEGGFSENEFAKMRGLENLHSISLGPRILRADSAMIAAITLVQEFLGDWN